MILFYNCIKFPLFKDPTSTVLISKDGDLLSARIADDGQWRFPESDSIPKKFELAIKCFEDEYFEYHFGVNPISILRAIKQNLSEKKIVSGASTLTMQTIRLSRKNKSRTISEKIKEIILSIRLEFSKEKKEIMLLYASNAPFGGNVVGLDAAAWRYYNRSSFKLSWGEITALAVLPNAPSLIYPGKNQQLLLEKRNRLLNKLYSKGIIDKNTCELAKIENLPNYPHPLPQTTSHLTNRLIKDGRKGKVTVVSIDKNIQEKMNLIISNNHDNLKHNDIHNASILIIDVENQNVVAYVGNSNCPLEDSGSKVDMITSPRSTGSTLKPILFSSLLDNGTILPNSLVNDIPTQILSFTPQNFYRTYDGVVSASNALVRSLNIPSVILLNKFGQKRFYDKLKKLNIHSLKNNAKHYGLSLILGGSEITMWELGKVYLGMARSLKDYKKNNYMYDASNYNTLDIINKKKKKKVMQKESQFSASSIWHTFDILTELNRPISEGDWEQFSSSSKIAWKTGTSFGHRDAWSIGITPEYIVIVWVGNSDGEGRMGLTGTKIAAPIMFDAFNKLPRTSWFETPYNNMIDLSVCNESGDLASRYCVNTSEQLMPESCKKAQICKYHKILHLDSTLLYRVNSSCYNVKDMKLKSWFTLSPMCSYYHRKVNPFYKKIPDFHLNCQKIKQDNMQIIYPKNNAKLFLPIGLDGKRSNLIISLAHNNTKSSVYWHLDGMFIGETSGYHKKKIDIKPGNHNLTIIDDNGEEEKINFYIIEN